MPWSWLSSDETFRLLEIVFRTQFRAGSHHFARVVKPITMRAVRAMPGIHLERKVSLMDNMSVSLNPQRDSVRQIELEKNAED